MQPLEGDSENESISTLQVDSEGSGERQNSIELAAAPEEKRVHSMLNGTYFKLMLSLTTY